MKKMISINLIQTLLKEGEDRERRESKRKNKYVLPSAINMFNSRHVLLIKGSKWIDKNLYR